MSARSCRSCCDASASLCRNMIVRLNRENIEDRTSSVRYTSSHGQMLHGRPRSINQSTFHRNETKYKNACHIRSTKYAFLIGECLFSTDDFLFQAFDCENHVRVLLRRKGKHNDVFVCSTNAFSPKIYYFNVRILVQVPFRALPDDKSSLA